MIYTKRMTAQTDEDFVVFLIGMRINKVWMVHKWLPVAIGMLKMLRELDKTPELGMVHYKQWVGRTTIAVQYWKSFEHLEAYARNDRVEHLPVWKKFNQYLKEDGAVGIWHETYVSGKGRYECVYNNMPRFGLANMLEHVEAKGHYKSARSRLNVK